MAKSASTHSAVSSVRLAPIEGDGDELREKGDEDNVFGVSDAHQKTAQDRRAFCGGATGCASGVCADKSSYSETIAIRPINRQPSRPTHCSMRISTANSPVIMSAAMPISNKEAPLLPSAVNSARRAPKRAAVLTTIATTGPGVAISKNGGEIRRQ